jgi:hypothetical protein
LLVTRDNVHGAGVGIEDLIVAGPEFEGEVGTEWDEAVEVHIVADGPGQTEEKNDGERESGEFEFLCLMHRRTEDSPAKQERQESARGGVSKEREGPHEAVEGVVAKKLRVPKLEREPEKEAYEESGERGIPNPGIGDDDAGWGDGPEPCSEDARGRARNASSSAMEGDANESGKDRVEDDSSVKGSECKDPKDFEDCGEDQRIDRRNPSGRTCRLTKDTAEAIALCDGGGNVADFILERSRGENLVRNEVGSIGEIENSKKKSGGGDEPGGGEEAEEFLAHEETRIAPIKRRMEKSLSRA